MPSSIFRGRDKKNRVFGSFSRSRLSHNHRSTSSSKSGGNGNSETTDATPSRGSSNGSVGGDEVDVGDHGQIHGPQQSSPAAVAVNAYPSDALSSIESLVSSLRQEKLQSEDLVESLTRQLKSIANERDAFRTNGARVMEVLTKQKLELKIMLAREQRTNNEQFYKARLEKERHADEIEVLKRESREKEELLTMELKSLRKNDGGSIAEPRNTDSETSDSHEDESITEYERSDTFTTFEASKTVLLEFDISERPCDHEASDIALSDSSSAMQKLLRQAETNEQKGSKERALRISLARTRDLTTTNARLTAEVDDMRRMLKEASLNQENDNDDDEEEACNRLYELATKNEALSEALSKSRTEIQQLKSDGENCIDWVRDLENDAEAAAKEMEERLDDAEKRSAKIELKNERLAHENELLHMQLAEIELETMTVDSCGGTDGTIDKNKYQWPLREMEERHRRQAEEMAAEREDFEAEREKFEKERDEWKEELDFASQSLTDLAGGLEQVKAKEVEDEIRLTEIQFHNEGLLDECKRNHDNKEVCKKLEPINESSVEEGDDSSDDSSDDSRDVIPLARRSAQSSNQGLENVHKELGEALAMVDEMQSENDTLRASVEDALGLATRMNLRMTNFVVEHEGVVKLYEEKIKSLKEESDRVRASLEEENNDLSSECAESSASLAALRRDIDELRASANEEKSLVETCEEVVGNLNQENFGLKKAQSLLAEELRTEKEANRFLEQKCNKSHSENDALQSKINALRSSLNTRVDSPTTSSVGDISREDKEIIAELKEANGELSRALETVIHALQQSKTAYECLRMESFTNSDSLENLQQENGGERLRKAVTGAQPDAYSPEAKSPEIPANVEEELKNTKIDLENRLLRSANVKLAKSLLEEIDKTNSLKFANEGLAFRICKLVSCIKQNPTSPPPATIFGENQPNDQELAN